MVEKRQARRKQTGEDFTPPELVNEILDQLPTDLWDNPDKTWLDNSAGNGNFLVEVKRRLLEAGHTEDHILANMIYAVELMPDNCEEMIIRLYGAGNVEMLQGKKIPTNYRAPGIVAVFKHNGILVPHIVAANGLKYDYSFGEPETWGNGLFTSEHA